MSTLCFTAYRSPSPLNDVVPCRKVVADDLLRLQLNTMDEERVASFESDPCKMTDRYAPVEHEGALYYRCS